MLLVPATMELLGDKNWWLPRWLDRILPNINIEGTPDDVERVRRPIDRADEELVTRRRGAGELRPSEEIAEVAQ